MQSIRPRSELQANWSNKNNFLSTDCLIHGTLVPQEVTQGSFLMTQRMGITSSVTQAHYELGHPRYNGVRVLVVYSVRNGYQIW